MEILGKKDTATAILIDIEQEIKAIRVGECGGCRVGFTHRIDKTCCNKLPHYKKMIHCLKCNHMYNFDAFKTCPVC